MNNKLDILAEVASAEGMFLSGLVEAMKVIKISTNFCENSWNSQEYWKALG